MTDRKGTSTREKVTVDLDYVAFLHDFLRLNLAKQKEVLGERPVAQLEPNQLTNSGASVKVAKLEELRR